MPADAMASNASAFSKYSALQPISVSGKRIATHVPRSSNHTTAFGQIDGCTLYRCAILTWLKCRFWAMVVGKYVALTAINNFFNDLSSENKGMLPPDATTAKSRNVGALLDKRDSAPVC